MTAFLIITQLALAANVQPSVEPSAEQLAVHVLAGSGGEQISSCGVVDDRWGCEALDIDGVQPMAVLFNTEMVRLGNVEPESETLTIRSIGGVAEMLWDQPGVSTTAPTHEVFVIRLDGATADPAPIVNVTFGGTISEARCGDDGRFPDAGVNDGVFTCALVASASAEARKTAEFQLRVGPLEERPLGALVYTGPPGIRFAQLTVDDPSAAVSDSFILPVSLPGGDLKEGKKPDILSPKEMAIELGEYEEPPATTPAPGPAPSPAPAPDLPQQGASMAPSSGIVGTVLALCLLVVGVLLGRSTRRNERPLDGVEVVSIGPLDGRGPIPVGGGVLIHVDPPRSGLLHLVKSLTSYRRIVLVCIEKPDNLQPALDLVWVKDPDWRGILSVVDRWCVDGGVPPVVLIEGADVVIDTGGASPSPILELVDALDGRAWMGIVEPDGGAADLEIPRWDWLPDKGWSAR